MTTVSAHYQKGLEILRQVGGEHYDGPINALHDVSPVLSRLTVEFCYGELLSRERLDLPARQLCTVAVLAGMANAQPQLHYHIRGALNVGCTAEEIIEIVLLVTVFSGFPAAGNALFVARDVFMEYGVVYGTDSGAEVAEQENRYEKGITALEEISAGAGKEVVRHLSAISDDLARWVVEFSYGDVLSRQRISHRMKELAVIALLTAKGNALPQLRVHIRAARHVGVADSEIIEVIQQMAIYAGFPAALNGLFAAKEIFAAE